VDDAFKQIERVSKMNKKKQELCPVCQKLTPGHVPAFGSASGCPRHFIPCHHLFHRIPASLKSKNK
jgi:hypothetical protein